jgi:hypothetical protein
MDDPSAQLWLEVSSASRMQLQVSPKSSYIAARLWGFKFQNMIISIITAMRSGAKIT